ncbi:ATPase [hydrothermal vent metagenome]|uniref:ATPase n=1 Tax=hydrothermal vent metagenome TaxID=652676 RepID=A0A1W1CNS9_9ZZZZ
MIEQLIKYSTAKLAQTLPSYKRFLFDKIDFNAKLIGIIGARGTGKTTLTLQYLKELKMASDQFLYISCDHPLVASKTLLEIAEEFSQYGGRVLVIDEIHKKENFCIELKNIYDFIDIQIIFTGSSAIHLENCQSDLSRRALIYRLPELSLREFIELKTEHRFDAVSLDDILNHHLDISSDILQKIKPLQHYNHYLKFGAYPIFLEGEESYLSRLVEIINETLTYDIATIYNVPMSNIASLHKLLEVICRSNPYEINYEKISAMIGISKNTLKQYLHYLEQASLLRTIGGMARGNTYIAKPDKIYLHNTNLMSVLCSNSTVETLRETFFVSQVKYNHTLHYPKQGDFQVDEKWFFEVGGANKTFKQIKDLEHSFLVKDKIESGFKNSIPLWLFGFLR